ncbi:hypothetical protein J2741_000581 [Methanolinea mesophila]|uniref:C2 family cysteine protease n=1 Tax=Methanolinea mesophila TaxID=547055 RepID=UPI001AE2CE8E|nr:C2 family cysteine protease [Methanolinea mesophila]MBP1928034.1 hypothetical protein [Methanolinea mesophila]
MKKENVDSEESFCSEAQNTGANLLGAAPAISQWKSCGTFCNPMLPPITSRMNFREPMQGYSADCYFIAALSSVAWAAQSSLSTSSTSFKFYNPDPSIIDPNKRTISIAIDQNLPVEASGKMIFASCYVKTAVVPGMPPVETWPALFEKAYASFRAKTIGDLPMGNGITALVNILSINSSAWKYYYIWDATLTNVLTRSPDNSSNILASGKTKYPMVAWTRNATNAAGLYPNHTYSLLGISDGYIVLRNPYANRDTSKVLPEPTAGVKTAGTWNPDGLPDNLIDFSDTKDGIFALRADIFAQNFLKFGRINNLLENPSSEIVAHLAELFTG